MSVRIKLGEICHVVTKGTTPTSIGLSFEEDGIPFLRIQNIGDSTIALDDVLYISDETHKTLKRSIIKPRDFLITIAGTIGKVALVPNNFPESNCNQAIAILRFDYEKLLPNFLLHWLSTPDAIEQITGKKVTATISNLSLGQIRELEIPLPPLAEQKRIAAILDKADSLRRKRQQAIQLADQFLRAVFLDMFGDPVTNPKGWEKIQIGDVTDKVKTWNPCAENDVLFDYIDLSSVDNNKKEIIKINKIESNSAPSRARQLIKKGDVLVSTVRPNLNGAAKVLFESDYLTASTGYCVLRPKLNLITQNYLFLLITSESFIREMINKSTGANYPAVSDSIIKNYEFELPSMQLLEEFEKICRLTEKLKNDSKKFSNESLFESLSQKAFAGEL
jgi:type I restriction enzyme S subunit